MAASIWSTLSGCDRATIFDAPITTPTASATTAAVFEKTTTPVLAKLPTNLPVAEMSVDRCSGIFGSARCACEDAVSYANALIFGETATLETTIITMTVTKSYPEPVPAPSLVPTFVLRWPTCTQLVPWLHEFIADGAYATREYWLYEPYHEPVLTFYEHYVERPAVLVKNSIVGPGIGKLSTLATSIFVTITRTLSWLFVAVLQNPFAFIGSAWSNAVSILSAISGSVGIFNIALVLFVMVLFYNHTEKSRKFALRMKMAMHTHRIQTEEIMQQNNAELDKALRKLTTESTKVIRQQAASIKQLRKGFINARDHLQAIIRDTQSTFGDRMRETERKLQQTAQECGSIRAQVKSTAQYNRENDQIFAGQFTMVDDALRNITIAIDSREKEMEEIQENVLRVHGIVLHESSISKALSASVQNLKNEIHGKIAFLEDTVNGIVAREGSREKEAEIRHQMFRNLRLFAQANSQRVTTLEKETHEPLFGSGPTGNPSGKPLQQQINDLTKDLKATTTKNDAIFRIVVQLTKTPEKDVKRRNFLIAKLAQQLSEPSVSGLSSDASESATPTPGPSSVTLEPLSGDRKRKPPVPEELESCREFKYNNFSDVTPDHE